jgi:glyoxylase-like metal-dependent hydrolase (beta-lactamase superfamily II)
MAPRVRSAALPPDQEAAVKTALQYPFSEPPVPGTVTCIQPGVLWLRMPLPMTLDHINLYLLEDDAGWWIVDTGLRGEKTREHWEQVFAAHLGGKPVIGLLCTHCHPDHIGQAGWLSERWKAPLWMTHGEYYCGRVFSGGATEGPLWESVDFYQRAGAGEAFLASFRRRTSGFTKLVEPLPRSFHRLRDGDVLTIGGSRWEAVIGHGHSPEHLCLLNRERKLLLSGDQVIPIITPNVSVLAIEPDGNPMQEWLASHQRFLGLPGDVLVLPAHNTPFFGLHERLRRLIAHHEDHLAALEEACVRPSSALELLPAIFKRKLDVEQTGLALGECIAHLNLLLARGRVVREADADGLVRYAAVDPAVASRARTARHDRDDDPVMVYEGEPI